MKREGEQDEVTGIIHVTDAGGFKYNSYVVLIPKVAIRSKDASLA